MIKSIKEVVCDAGPIIHLDELDCLDLLTDFQKIIVPATVCEEVERHRSSALKRRDVMFTTLCQRSFPDEPLLTICEVFSLDEGEIEALAVMKKNPRAMFLADDASARLVAEHFVHKTFTA